MQLIKANIVFDIGANIGQFAQEIRAVGFAGEIISFEPLSSAHTVLLNSSRHDRKWIVHPRTALGRFDGDISINIAGNSVSSSALEMLEEHLSAAPKSKYSGSENSPLSRLDSVANEYLRESSRLFIKIDVQGYESEVLAGASESLMLAKGLACELSLVPLYEGQLLWQDIIKILSSKGFKLWAIQRGFSDPKTGQTLQVDGIFLRDLP